jgi:hypothetical protein
MSSSASSCPEAKRVLNYLREMIDFCRIDRHPEMQKEYEESWLTVAAKVYGPLPDRWRMATLKCQARKPTPPLCSPDEPLTDWQRETLEWPRRKIIGGYKKESGEKNLILECGHHCWTPHLRAKYPAGETRPCDECYAEAKAPKKKPASASSSRAEAVSA